MSDTIQSVLGEGVKPRKIARNMRFWLTPPDLYAKLDAEFHFDFDPCPCPRPEGYDGIIVEWGKSNYINPPFCRADAFRGHGATAFVRKAIEEAKKGKQSVLILPVQSYVNMLLEAGAELRSAGRVNWISADTGESWKGYNAPTSCALFILRPKVPKSVDTGKVGP